MDIPVPAAVLEPSVPDAPTPEPAAAPAAPAAAPANEPAAPAAPSSEPAAPAAPAAGADPAAPAEVLYDLPDGRRVNAETLAKEFKENFLPDYTRKSQKLSQYESINNPPKPAEDIPEWQKPGYQPQSWAEAIQIAKQEAIKDLATAAQQEDARMAAIATEVDTQIAEIKAADPQLDENALFLHANKYGFRDLKAAHVNMQDLKKVAADTEQRVLKNIKTRGGDPVAVQPGTPGASDAIDLGSIRGVGSALEFLQRVKGNS